MAWLGEELPEKEQDGRTPFAPRAPVKDVVEERLFAHRRDLLTRLDLVFIDTTSLHFEGASGQTLGRHGYSKDHPPDLRQMILAVLIEGDGGPVCSEMWAGQHRRCDDANPGDRPAAPALRHRTRVRGRRSRHDECRDRGGAGGMAAGCTSWECASARTSWCASWLLNHPAPFVPLAVKKRGKEIDYEAKTVMLAGRHYMVCRNQQEAAKDAADRASIVAALERQLAKGDKALVGNTGFRCYLKTITDEHFAIDPDKIAEEQRFDGIFVLRTNTDLDPLEAMLCYK
jgi:hypothetical protein